MVVILMMLVKSAQIDYSRSSRNTFLKAIWKESKDVIISVHDATSKILSHYSTYVIDVVM